MPPDREIVATRLLDAPRDLVFRLWTEPKHIERWWGPNGFTVTTSEMTLLPGGVWRFVLHGPDGTNFHNKIVYDKIVPPERLAGLNHGVGLTNTRARLERIYGSSFQLLFANEPEAFCVTVKFPFRLESVVVEPVCEGVA